jgi:hypothetical protein
VLKVGVGLVGMDLSHHPTPSHRRPNADPLAVLGLEVIDPMADADRVAAATNLRPVDVRTGAL